MKIIRVFCRRTNATPDDEDVRVNQLPGFFDEADEVHISVAFTWDLPRAEYLARYWKDVAPVKIGGPATGERGEEFTPGMYLKHGYTITSRGCPNKCWFCSVWKREGGIRELPIRDGWNILDDNLLACSDGHIRAVFEMLKRQKRKAEFTGGLEAARLKDWHIELFAELKPKQMFFAYDTPDDLDPLIEAGRLFSAAGYPSGKSHALRCYVLCGYAGDTIEKAGKRMEETVAAGFGPMAMLWRKPDGKKDSEWRKFQRSWAAPQAIYASGRS